MDYDRKSAVSSFYGDRRPSSDALNQDRIRRDSSSSFFKPNALPAGAQSPGHDTRYSGVGYGSAMGYGNGGNATYADAGLEEAEPWDVYADFNNTGPKYSSAFGVRGNEASYQPLQDPPHTPRSAKLEDETSASGAPVELVTVPALGPEWKASELRNMTSRGRREDKNDVRRQYWRDFSRGERGLFGRKWLNKRFIVFFCFGLCAAIGIVLAFTIPRVPSFLFDSNKPLKPAAAGWFNDSIPIQFSRSPANFSFPASVDLQVNTGSNFLPLTFTRLDGTVYDLTSGRQIATGHVNKTTVPAKKFTTLQMPLNFTYSAVNTSDVTWTSWHDACENTAIAVNGTRPGVKFRLIIEMGIAGLIGSHSTSTTVTNAACPIELPQNAS